MTLTELSSLTRDLLFDLLPTGSTAWQFSNTSVYRAINVSMHSVWVLARSLQRNLFVADQTVSVTTAALVAPVPLAAPYTRVARPLLVWRSSGTTPLPLGIVELGRTGLEVPAAAVAAPRVVLLNDGLALLNPAVPITVRCLYVAGLPDMTDGSNTPGQTGSNPATGIANFLPLEYHGLIALKAAVILLKAERAEWTGLQAEYEEHERRMTAALVRSDDTSEDD